VLSRLRSALFGAPAAGQAVDYRSGFKAGYDAARTTTQSRKHWADADALAAVSSNTPAVRRTLRNRARYEVANNCYARGVVTTYAADVVGTGGRPEVLSDDERMNSAVEAEYAAWCGQHGVNPKLRLMAETRLIGGEAFARLGTNARLAEAGHVALDFRLYEADQVGHPWGYTPWTQPTGDDGIDCDERGDPTAFHFLKAHPGDQRVWLNRLDADVVDARSVIHWRRLSRPGELRPVTPLAPALSLFAQLRRFSVAVLSSAELAASIAAVLKTQGPVPGETAVGKPWEEMELVRNMILTLPANYELQQLKAEQPITGFEAFVNVVLREIGRCLDMPFGVVAGDSSRYNYSSARLDRQLYQARINAERADFTAIVLQPLFRAWLEEAVLVVPRLAAYRGKLRDIRVNWYFDEPPSIDPVKDATTDDLRLANGTTTYRKVFEARGEDYEEAFRQQAKEQQMRRDLGLPTPQPKPTVMVAADAPESPGRAAFGGLLTPIHSALHLGSAA